MIVIWIHEVTSLTLVRFRYGGYYLLNYYCLWDGNKVWSLNFKNRGTCEMGIKKKLGMGVVTAALGLSLIGGGHMRILVIRKYHKTRLQRVL